MDRMNRTGGVRFFAIFLIVWLMQYHSWKSRIKEMNDCIKKNGINK